MRCRNFLARVNPSRPDVAILIEVMVKARDVVAARSWSASQEPITKAWWADVLADPRARIRRQPRPGRTSQKAYCRLADEPRPVIEIACSKCDWKAAFNRQEQEPGCSGGEAIGRRRVGPMVRCKAKTFEPVTKVNQNGPWGSAARAIQGNNHSAHGFLDEDDWAAQAAANARAGVATDPSRWTRKKDCEVPFSLTLSRKLMTSGNR